MISPPGVATALLRPRLDTCSQNVLFGYTGSADEAQREHGPGWVTQLVAGPEQSLHEGLPKCICRACRVAQSWVSPCVAEGTDSSPEVLGGWKGAQRHEVLQTLEAGKLGHGPLSDPLNKAALAKPL